MTREENFQGHRSIAVDGLTKRYGTVEALRGISFSVGPGEIVGFLGPNGAGKTTTMKILTGFMAPTEGRATVVGLDIQQAPRAVQKKIGYLPENVPLYEEMLVYDYLEFVAQIREVARGERRQKIVDVAKMTGLQDMLGHAIHELSKGYRQRVGLAQAIVHEPEVIILDEPMTGLDPNQIIEIRDVITAIGQTKTILFSTHILQEVTAVCDRIIIIAAGQLRADGSLEELRDLAAIGEDASLEALFRHFTTDPSTAPESLGEPDDEPPDQKHQDDQDEQDEQAQGDEQSREVSHA